MASGRLGAVDLAATTNTLVHTGRTGYVTTCSVNFANRNATPVVVRLFHLDGAIGTLSTEDWIEPDVTIQPNGVLERTGIVLAATHTIVAYSDTANVSVQVWGWEELA